MGTAVAAGWCTVIAAGPALVGGTAVADLWLGMSERSSVLRPVVTGLVKTFERHPVPAAVVAASAVTLLLLLVAGLVWTVRMIRHHKVPGERVGTLVTAAIATGVSAQGMWVFFDRSLHLQVALRVLFFAFIELMVITSALRARSSMRDNHSAGVDGVAMWVLTCLSAVLAATDADNVGTGR